MHEQALSALVDAIAALHTSSRTALAHARLEDPREAHQQLVDVLCGALKRLALDPAGIDMAMYPPPSAETSERAAVILTAVERAFRPEL